MKNIANILFLISLALVFSVSFASEAEGVSSSASSSASSSSVSQESNASAKATADDMNPPCTSASSEVAERSGEVAPENSYRQSTGLYSNDVPSETLDAKTQPNNITADTSELVKSLEITDSRIGKLISKIDALESRQIKILNLFIVNFIALGIILALEIILLIRQRH